jgi:amino acid transporter
MAISAPAEITAAATIVQFWNSSVSPAVWITVFGLAIALLNFCGVRLYGEVSQPPKAKSKLKIVPGPNNFLV